MNDVAARLRSEPDRFAWGRWLDGAGVRWGNNTFTSCSKWAPSSCYITLSRTGTRVGESGADAFTMMKWMGHLTLRFRSNTLVDLPKRRICGLTA